LIIDLEYLNDFIDDFPIGIARNDTTGNLPNHFNKYLLELFGWEQSDIDTMEKWFDKAYPDPYYKKEALKLWQKMIDETTKSNKAYSDAFEIKVACKDGSFKWCETRFYQKGIFIYGTFIDISERKSRDKLAKLRILLSNLVHKKVPKEALLQTALDEAEAITKSQIGFLHFVDSDQNSVSLQVWSTNTLANMCFAKGEGFHYPIEQAGVWVDCIHQKKPLIVNNYNDLTSKKGLPEGHAPLSNFISVPLFKQDKIVAIIGVGHKKGNYNQADVQVVQKVAQMAYEYYERLHAESKIAHMAYYDTLTGLPNRTLLSDRINQYIKLAKRKKQEVAICYIDLDGFKPVNDRYGHELGDRLLQVLAKRFILELREGDTIARIGGDEFVLVFTGFLSKKELTEILLRIIDTVNTPFEIDEHRIHISCSIGVTTYPTDDNDTDTLIRHADQAMYRAKELGKSNFVIHTPVESFHAQKHIELLKEFTVAIDHSQIILHFQPKVDLKNGSVVGFEVLSRWQHPSKGLLYPKSFIHVIENTPQEVILGEWLIGEAMRILSLWHKNGDKYKLSINISPRHIQLKGFSNYLAKILSLYPKKLAKYLELEILEIAAISDIQTVIEVLNECKKLGVSFSLDDFGTGYSSLTHFYRLPIDILKIDQNFVKNMIDNSGDIDIVEGVIQLASTLKRPVVAEGVETMEIALLLLQMGSNYAQGFGIAKPMPFERIAQWIEQWHNNQVWHHMLKHKNLATQAVSNVAIYSHQMWVDKVIAYANGDSSDIPPLEGECQFERWYKGLGRARYGSKESYPFLQAIHHQVHESAKEIHKARLRNDKKSVKSLLDKLMAQSKELTAMIDKISKQ
jgi:diguanylate cyclase (GGDEF)-like protein